MGSRRIELYSSVFRYLRICTLHSLIEYYLKSTEVIQNCKSTLYHMVYNIQQYFVLYCIYILFEDAICLIHCGKLSSRPMLWWWSNINYNWRTIVYFHALICTKNDTPSPSTVLLHLYIQISKKLHIIGVHIESKRLTQSNSLTLWLMLHLKLIL